MDIHSTCHGVGGYGPPLYTVFLGMALHSTQAQFLTLWEISTVWGSMVRAASKAPGGKTGLKTSLSMLLVREYFTAWKLDSPFRRLVCAFHGMKLGMDIHSTCNGVGGYGPPLYTGGYGPPLLCRWV